jgi:putative glycosyltransferase (TIGR04348 family)
MKIFLACPAPHGSRKGNRVTAVRWAGILEELGHEPAIGQNYRGSACDLLIALHARKSAAAIRAYRRHRPRAPLVLCLTGTDLYGDIRTSKAAQRSLELADRLVLLQPCGLDELEPRWRRKARVIYQSAEPVGDHKSRRSPASKRVFEVAVLGHLRHEKDPFRTALALGLLPRDLPIRVTHLGQALSKAMARQAKHLAAADRRYRWLGEVPGPKARRLLAASDVLVLSSRLEGGANVISEALADRVPILASRIPGSVGLLGEGYPGFFPVEDTEALAELLARAATDRRYYAGLQAWCTRLAPMVAPARERAAWEKLLAEVIAHVW